MNLPTFIKITRHPYEEPYHVNLVIQACNGEHAGSLEIYDNAKQLKSIGEALQGFPFDPRNFKWELGSEKPEDRFAFYFLFELFLNSPNGSEAGIHFRMNNNEEHPNSAITDFYLICEPAAINNLGKLFERFSELETTELFWDGSTGQIA
ncbi:hypothetical protein [Marinoscillum sp. MHG1-6]|uniref:hypothetical protein n=1 Tax=Marinoscillum sp. MHG1-6 TaxID=2959627 RepID=UPI002157F1BB|nr:hypothetical protein [Marinoscillum sp. MHG1-6]